MYDGTGYELGGTIQSNRRYSREEAAALLGITLSTLKRLINAGYLRVSEPAESRRIFIEGESLLAVLNQFSHLSFAERRA